MGGDWFEGACGGRRGERRPQLCALSAFKPRARRGPRPTQLPRRRTHAHTRRARRGAQRAPRAPCIKASSSAAVGRRCAAAGGGAGAGSGGRPPGRGACAWPVAVGAAAPPMPMIDDSCTGGSTPLTYGWRQQHDSRQHPSHAAACRRPCTHAHVHAPPVAARWHACVPRTSPACNCPRMRPCTRPSPCTRRSPPKHADIHHGGAGGRVVVGAPLTALKWSESSGNSDHPGCPLAHHPATACG